MSKDETHLKGQKKQLLNLGDLRTKMLLEGIPITSTIFGAVDSAYNGLLGSLGFKVPKPVFSILKLYGFSPGTITLWFDTENGFYTAARKSPLSPPVNRRATEALAFALMRGEYTHETFESLMVPDEDIDN